MSATWKKALADITHRKGRTILVVLGIFVGVFGLVGINFTEDTLFEALTFRLSSDIPDITMNVEHLDPTLVPTLQAIENVKAVQYESFYQTQWHVSQAPGVVSLTLVSYPDLQRVPINPFQLLSGRLPQAPDEVLMEYGDLNLQPFAVGSTISIESAQGTTELHVVGTERTPGVDPAERAQALAYMTDAGLQAVAGSTTADLTMNTSLRHQIAFTLQDSSRATTTANAIQATLLAHGIQVANVNFAGQTDPSSLQAIHSVFALLRVFAILAVVMSGFLILNTIMTLIAEQTAIIGTLKAIGGTRAAIMRGYLISVAIYAVLGTVPGIVAGIVGGYALANALAPTIPLAISPFQLTPEVIPLGLGVGLGVPLLAAFPPLINGTRITVREALSAYGVSAGQGKGPITWLSQRLIWVPQTLWLGLSGTFRKRWRVGLTLLTLCVAGICFLTVQTATTSVNATIASVYSRWDADVEVQMAPQTLAQTQQQLAAVPNVQLIERYGQGGTVTPWGRLEIWGVEADTHIYHYQLTGGRWLRPGDTGVILLSDDALAKSGLKIGNTISVNNRGGTFAWTIIGSVKQATTNLGGLGSSITTTDDLYHLTGVEPTGQTGLTAELLIRAHDRSTQAVDQLATTLNQTLLDQSQAQPDKSGDGPAFVTTIAQEAHRHEQSWYILYLLLYIVALIVGIVGILGLANALITSVLERQREIGMLRALGATSQRVAQVFWTEGLALAGIAWLISAILGLPLAYLFVQQLRQGILPTDFVMDATAFVVMLLALFAIASLASTLPAQRASHMRIATTLRYE